RAPFRSGWTRGGPFMVKRVEGERLLSRPPAVDGRLADTGLLGHRIHADRFEAMLEKQLGSGSEYRVVGFLAARTSAPRNVARDFLAHAAPLAAWGCGRTSKSTVMLRR